MWTAKQPLTHPFDPIGGREGTLALDRYGGRERVQLRVLDAAPAR